MNMKLRHIISIINLAILLGSIGYADASNNYGGKIYVIGTSITCGRPNHDPDHSILGSSDDYTHQYTYWIDYYMNHTYGIQTNISAWFSNATATTGWDKYNLGTGANVLNDVYPAGWDGYGMRLDNTPMCVNGTWGRALWRLPDWYNIKFLIVEGGHHDISKNNSDWHEMSSDIWDIYNQSHYYGFNVILLAMTPDGRADTSNQWYENITKTNEWRKSFCENHTDIYFADVFHSNLTIFHTDGTWEANETLFSEEDGEETHPNINGYKLMGKIVAATLNSAIDSYAEFDSSTFGASATVEGSPENFVYSEYGSETYDASVTVQSPTVPTANFTWSADGHNISFTDTSDGTIVNWSWNFGDGSTSYEQNPTHTYAADGTYNVTLTVVDNNNISGNITKGIIISSGGGGIVRDSNYTLLLYLFGGLAVGCPVCAIIYLELKNGGIT